MSMAMLRLAVLVVCAAALSGCVSWASYPAAPGETAIKDPNNPAVEELMMTGMRWVVQKYPPVDASGAHVGGGKLALNLPFGIKPKVYRRVAEAAGGGAEPLTQANQSLPIYHVKEIRIRGDEAQLIAIVPAATLGASPTGGPVYQEVKLGFTGGLGPWRVVSFREWGAGGEPPEPNFYVSEDAAAPNAKSLPGGP
jgi:hypothetical protein